MTGHKAATCPVCGKTASEKDITWYGMCSSCNKAREQANKMKDN